RSGGAARSGGSRLAARAGRATRSTGRELGNRAALHAAVAVVDDDRLEARGAACDDDRTGDGGGRDDEGEMLAHERRPFQGSEGKEERMRSNERRGEPPERAPSQRIERFSGDSARLFATRKRSGQGRRDRLPFAALRLKPASPA